MVLRVVVAAAWIVGFAAANANAARAATSRVVANKGTATSAAVAAAKARAAAARTSSSEPAKDTWPPPSTTLPSPPPPQATAKKSEPPPPQPPKAVKEAAVVDVAASPVSISLDTDASVFKRLEQANTTALLELLIKLPVSLFELEFDSVEGRRQLGVVGEDIEFLIPEAVHVGRRAFPQAGGGLMYVENFAHVDKNVIFMTGVGAAQELAKRQQDLQQTVDKVEALAANQTLGVEQLETALKQEASAVDVERLAIERELKEHLVLEEHRLDKEAEGELSAALLRQSLENASLALEDDRARERIRQQDDSARSRHATSLALAEASHARQEDLRRRTDEEVLQQRLKDELRVEELRRIAELERVKAEAEAQAKTERENEDLRLRAMRAQAAEDRKKLLEAISLAADYIASGVAALLDDLHSLLTLVGALIVLIGGGFFAREFAILARTLAEIYFGRPQLIRESSRKRLALTRRYLIKVFSVLLMALKSPFDLCFLMPLVFKRAERRLERRVARRVGVEDAVLAGQAASAAAAYLLKLEGLRAQEAVDAARQACFLDGVVLQPELRERVVQLSTATKNARQNRAPFRHMLLHGPPGTGKTLVARRLAAASGLEYALMSGGDVGPLGAEGVTALHSLFRWARTSATGVLIFIDEAEAFLASRSRARLTEHMRNALNAFLYQTGSPTRSFVLVLATNRADDLDDAVLDRIDETLFFGLPSPTTRLSLVNLYYNTYIGSLAKSKKSFLKRIAASFGPAQLTVSGDVDQALFKRIASDTTEGFSGREIEKLFVAAQAIAYGLGATMNAKTLLAVAMHKREEHARKDSLMEQLNNDSNNVHEARHMEEENQQSEIVDSKFLSLLRADDDQMIIESTFDTCPST